MNTNASTADEPTTLWVIEDNGSYRNSIAALLESTRGLCCTHAFRSCEEALKTLEEDYAPEIILMDIGLLSISGLEGLSRIKALSPATALIMLTVFDDDPNAKRRFA